MSLGRLFHYTFDAILLSTVAAGVRRSSGFTFVFQLIIQAARWPDIRLLFHSRPDASAVPEGTMRSIAERYLGVGESIFDMIQATAVNSSYFKRDTKGPR
jgi:hypothetical protein